MAGVDDAAKALSRIDPPPAPKKSFWTPGKTAVATGLGVSGLWLLPQVLADSCDRSAQQMGLPAGSCGYICSGGSCLMLMMSMCMVMMMFMQN